MIQDVEWDGKIYSVKYTFQFIQRLKRKGVSVPEVYQKIRLQPDAAGAYLDEYVILTCEALLEAGAYVNVEDVYAQALVNPEFAKACGTLFSWFVKQHYAVSPNAPKDETGTKNSMSQGAAS